MLKNLYEMNTNPVHKQQPKRIKILILYFIVSIPFMVYSQDCNCEENFYWVKKVFEENDAGFSNTMKNKGIASYQKHCQLYLNKVKLIENSEECIQTLNEWLTFFRSGHIGIVPNNQIDRNQNVKQEDGEIIKEHKDWQSLDVDLRDFKKYLQSKSEPDYEGVWEFAPYTIGIKKIGEDYWGFIIKADGVYWRKGQVKLKIKQEGKKVRSVYYMKNHSSQVFDNISLLGANFLQLGSIILKRILPEFENEPIVEQYLRSIKAKKPYYEQINETTSFLRIPSFALSEKQIIDSVITENRKKILNTKNLIIDLRNNGGGSNICFEELLPIIYTNPIRNIGVEFLSTPLNNQRMLALSKDTLYFAGDTIYNSSKKIKKHAQDSYNKLMENIDQFVNLDSIAINIERFDTTYQYPQYIGIIINENNASTTEQFLLRAKQSKKVKLFGTTTKGALDISNMYFAYSPCKEFLLLYGLSRSMRIPEMTIDGKGIQPDYYLDKSIPNYKWVKFIDKILNE